jgi:hypothetical protein
LNVRELISKLESLSFDCGENTEVEIAIAEVFSSGEDVRTDNINVHFNDDKGKIVIYG